MINVKHIFFVIILSFILSISCSMGMKKTLVQDQNDYVIMRYTKAIEADSLNVNAYISRGNYYEEVEQFENAILDFSKAISIDSSNIFAYLRRGHVYDKKGQPEIAILDYNKAISIKPYDAEIYFFRGFSYMVGRSEGKTSPENSVIDFTKAIELGTEMPEVYFWRAVAYKMLHEKVNAINDFKKFIVQVDGKRHPQENIAHNEIRLLEQELRDTKSSN